MNDSAYTVVNDRRGWYIRHTFTRYDKDGGYDQSIGHIGPFASKEEAEAEMKRRGAK